MNPIHRAASLALVLAACSSPAVCGGCGADGGLPDGELPSAFRIEAEVVSVEPVGGAPDWFCDPHIVDGAGADWVIDFAAADTAQPSFQVVKGGRDDSACERVDDGDCCEPATPTEDGGWSIVCHGNKTDSGPGLTRTFVFDIAADGSGSVTSSTTPDAGTGGSCVSRASWSALVVAP